jgi:hypothetical protein
VLEENSTNGSKFKLFDVPKLLNACLLIGPLLIVSFSIKEEEEDDEILLASDLS